MCVCVFMQSIIITHTQGCGVETDSVGVSSAELENLRDMVSTSFIGVRE